MRRLFYGALLLVWMGCRSAEVDPSTPPEAADAGLSLPATPPTFDRVPYRELLGNRQKVRANGSGDLVLGSTGPRLWAISLERGLGVRGELNYIHEEGYGGSNLGGVVFDVAAREGSAAVDAKTTDHRYWPDHLEVRSSAAGWTFREEKFISADDCVVDRIEVQHDGASARTLELTVGSPLMTLGREASGRIVGDVTVQGVASHYAFAATSMEPTAVPGTASVALNPARVGKPAASASHTWWTDSVWALNDGQHVDSPRWTAWGSTTPSDWVAIDFGQAVPLNRVVLDVYDDSAGGGGIRPPASMVVQVRNSAGAWASVSGSTFNPSAPAPGLNEVTFDQVSATALRIVLTHRAGFKSGLRELEAYPAVPRTERALHQRLEVPAGEKRPLTLAFCIGSGATEVEERVSSWLTQASPVERQGEEFEGWFTRNAPRLIAPDPFYERLWAYRWYLARYNLAEIRAGLLSRPAFYEGREFYSRVIQFSAPHILEEVRWLRDPAFAYGHLENLLESQLDARQGQFDGELPYLYADRKSNFYFINWIPAAAWGLQQVHPSPQKLPAMAAALARSVRGEQRRYDSDGDYLFKLGGVDTAFYATGMEYQPSFYWFADDMKLSPAAYPDIERVDFTSYAFANAHALDEMFTAAGRTEEAQDFRSMAQEIRASLTKVMWSAEDSFYYDVKAATHEPAKVKEIGGFFPFAFGVPSPGQTAELSVFDHLIREDEFWAKYPVSTISRQSKFFSQTVPGGCCHWNGPSWPFSTSIVLEGVARAVKEHGAVHREPVFRELLKRYTRQQFENEELTRPFVSESMNGDTGQWKSVVENYFHSKYNDLLIRHVAGLTPRWDEQLELNPISLGWPYFAFVDVPYHGKRLTIVWDQVDGDDRFGDGYEGLSVYADDQPLFGHPKLEHLTWDPATGTVTVQ